MSDLVRLLRLDAAHSGVPQRRRMYRHRRIIDEPLVVVPFSMTSESSSIWAVAVGTARDRCEVFVCPDPRIPALHARTFHRFLTAVRAYVEQHLRLDVVPTSRGEDRHLARSLPQFIFPNRSAAALILTAVPDRFRRFRWQHSHLEDSPDREDLGWLREGAMLLERIGVLGDVAASTLVVSLVDAVREVWVTGLSSAEESHLGMQAVWSGTGDRRAAWDAEIRVQPGPGLNPLLDTWANDEIIAKIGLPDGGVNPDWVTAVEAGPETARTEALFNAVLFGDPPGRRPLGAIVHPDGFSGVWGLMWDQIDALRQVHEAPSVVDRVDGERWSFASSVIGPLSDGTMSPIRGLWRTSRLASAAGDRAQFDEARQAIEDPLAQADLVCDGKAVAGEVTAVFGELRTRGTDVSRVILRCAVAPRVPPGAVLWWTQFPRQSWKATVDRIAGTDDGGAVVELLFETSRRKGTPDPMSLIGGFAVFTPFSLADGKGRVSGRSDLSPWMLTDSGIVGPSTET